MSQQPQLKRKQSHQAPAPGPASTALEPTNSPALSSKQRMVLAQATSGADQRVRQDHVTAWKVELDQINRELEGIVAQCRKNGESQERLRKWLNDYSQFIRRTSMSKHSFEGFEKHLALVRRWVSSGERVSIPLRPLL